MHNSREQNLDTARRFVDGELTRKQAQELIGGGRNCVYYWANEYKRSIGDSSAPPKRYRPGQGVRDEAAGEDEISRLSSLSKEELIDEVIKAKVGEARAKKGYEVKGGGASKEYVTLSGRNTK